MAPSAASRKGKKSWRRNIDTIQVGVSVTLSFFVFSDTDTDCVFLLVQLEQDIARQQKEEQQGTALQVLPDSNIFFLDKV